MAKAKLSELLSHKEINRLKMPFDIVLVGYLADLTWEQLNTIGLVIVPIDDNGCVLHHGSLAITAIEELTKRAIEKGLTIF